MSNRSRTTLILTTVFTAYWLITLRLDTQTNITTQSIISLTAWLFLVGAVWFSPWEERIQVFTMVCVSTLFECFCSLVWGAYVYRLDNLPLYVPPGHGLFYLTALRVAELPLLNRHSRLIIFSVFVGATAHLVHNLFAAPQPDLLGFVNWVIFLPFIVRGQFALLYAVSFTMTMSLEFYGTSLGIWTWAAVLPLVGLSAANPPACIGVGYCVMDGISRYLAPRAQELLRRTPGFTRAQAVTTD
jgi:hypothetical protein